MVESEPVAIVVSFLVEVVLVFLQLEKRICNGDLLFDVEWVDEGGFWFHFRYFSFQLVLYDWCNKGRMCYPICGLVHIK